MINLSRRELGRDGKGVGFGDVALPGKGAGPRLMIYEFAVVMQDDRIAKVGGPAKEMQVALIPGRNSVGILSSSSPLSLQSRGPVIHLWMRLLSGEA